MRTMIVAALLAMVAGSAGAETTNTVWTMDWGDDVFASSETPKCVESVIDPVGMRKQLADFDPRADYRIDTFTGPNGATFYNEWIMFSTSDVTETISVSDQATCLANYGRMRAAVMRGILNDRQMVNGRSRPAPRSRRHP